MSKKLTYDFVKDYIENKHPGCKLMSDKYVNSKTKLDIVCENGHIFSVCFNSITNMNSWCPVCAGLKKHNYESVKEFIENRHPGCKLISTEYVNSKTKLDIVCENGHEFSTCHDNIHQNKWCGYCSRNKKLTHKFVKEFIENKHSGCKLASQEYINSTELLSIKCENGHEFSMAYAYVQQNQWCPECMVGRRKQTCIEKYGHSNPMQNTEIALKQARKVNNPSTKIHWKTGEILDCQGGWEPLVIDYLNVNQIEFKWQHETFTLSSGSTYRPDLYLIEKDLWVEIKGRMYPDALEKWTEFHDRYPNSELWEIKKLKSIGIKIKYK